MTLFLHTAIYNSSSVDTAAGLLEPVISCVWLSSFRDDRTVIVCMHHVMGDISKLIYRSLRHSGTSISG